MCPPSTRPRIGLGGLQQFWRINVTQRFWQGFHKSGRWQIF
jgi:hypothetical protein